MLNQLRADSSASIEDDNSTSIFREKFKRHPVNNRIAQQQLNHAQSNNTTNLTPSLRLVAKAIKTPTATLLVIFVSDYTTHVDPSRSMLCEEIGGMK
jgi:hypothetical protein